jgi:threonine/homoserine/homoserine lactone efflux protein
LHQYGGIPHHSGLKHYWMLAVIGGALLVWLAVWVIRRRRGNDLAVAPAKPVK